MKADWLEKSISHEDGREAAADCNYQWQSKETASEFRECVKLDVQIRGMRQLLTDRYRRFNLDYLNYTFILSPLEVSFSPPILEFLGINNCTHPMIPSQNNYCMGGRIIVGR